MNYERLSALDSSFLVQEGRSTYMHIACTAILESGSLGAPGGGIEIDRLRDYVASRLHLLPRYRQRLGHVPITNDPIWIDDLRFDIGYHVRHTSLPRPGNDAQLRRLCARILERHLDRTRPLWECWFVEGLVDGRFAMIVKVHHCMVDGVAGVDLLAALLTTEPTDRIEPQQPWSPQPAPGDVELLRGEASRRALSGLRALGAVGRAVRETTPLAASVRSTAAGLVSLARSSTRAAGRMPFNHPIGPHRDLEWLDVGFDRVKAIRKTLGGTVNDIVLAVVAGAMRRYLEDRGIDSWSSSLRVAVPVNLRAADQHDGRGNRVSAWLADLPVGEHDALERLAAVRRVTAKLKDDHQAEAARTLTEAASWTGSGMLGVAMRALSRARAYNLVVTNVPGPPVPLYLLDARIASIFPHLPLFENQGLGIAVLSYAGRLYWGLTADWELVPDLVALRTAVMASLAELYTHAWEATSPVVESRSGSHATYGSEHAPNVR